MRFGIFYEHQLPKPWNPGDEARLFQAFQMLRDRPLRHGARPRQLHHRLLAPFKDPFEHGTPCRIGERAEQRGDGGGVLHEGNDSRDSSMSQHY